MKEQHGNGASAAALYRATTDDDDDDDAASGAGSNLSLPAEVRERVLKKLRDTLYENYKGSYAKTSKWYHSPL